ncbi:MAG: VWA domain-containing protein [Pyrinomonadaceae bacterium]
MTFFFRIILFVLIAAAHASPLFSQSEDDIINVDSSLVVLNAIISDNSGKHVSGLTQKNFKIFEEGTEQEISFFTAEETPFAAVLLIDTSGSMEGSISMARAAAIRFLAGLRQNDSAAIYRFDSKVMLVQDFSNSRDITDNIFDLKADGMTALNDAVFLAAGELSKRPEKRRAIIVLSDGQDTISKRSVEKALKAALAVNALIYTVDMSALNSSRRVQNQGPLKNFAEKTGGIFVATPGGVAMRSAFANIADELGVQYTLGYQPANVSRDGKWRTIELRVAKPNLTIRTRKGYIAEKAK